jgi:hypothetical protein
MDSGRIQAVAARFVRYLETGVADDGLFAPDVFCDFTMPRWRLQAEGRDAALELRRRGHPSPGTVPRWRCDTTERGFVVEVEERWHEDGRDWYCREMMRADLRSDAIAELSVYCTGDWDAERVAEHASAVRLLRP